jgi:hypothetical protein
VGHENHPSAFGNQFLDGWQSRLDAVVIANDAVFLRNVEVHANVDALAVDVFQIFDS